MEEKIEQLFEDYRLQQKTLTEVKAEILNLFNVSQQRELFYNFITWYNSKPKVEKPKDGLITTNIIEE